jgi:hypothetical protein
VPVPDFYAVVGAVGEDGFAFYGWMISEENAFLGVEFGDL